MFAFPKRVAVVYRENPDGDLALSFAAGLLARSPGSKLVVFVEHNPASAKLLLAAESSAGESQLARVRLRAAQKTGIEASDIQVVSAESRRQTDFGDDILVIDHRLVAERQDISVLTPFRESTLTVRSSGPIVVPFGHTETRLSLWKLASAIALSHKLPLIFYHTTWKNPAVASTDAAAHMSTEACEARRAIESTATMTGVEFQTVIEAADDVVEGTLHCAMRHNASLICMARGANTGLGCYVTRALRYSPIPILVAAAAKKEGQSA